MTWGDLKAHERELLMRAYTQGLNPKNRLLPQRTIQHLADLGLLHMGRNKKGRPLWRPTAEGIAVAASRGLEPAFLSRRSEYGYTAKLSQAMFGEPELVGIDAEQARQVMAARA